MHWGIEKGLYGRRDGTLREDASRLRKEAGVQVMAVLRNLVIYLCSFVDKPSLAAATRHSSVTPRSRWNSCQPQSENETPGHEFPLPF
jgi:hypothetical protein